MFDMHVHTNASDGLDSPKELVILAKETGLTGVAITDHDTVSGISEAIEMAEKTNFRIIPGVEISSSWDEMEIHILGYFIDYKCDALLDQLKFFQLKRDERIRKIVNKAIKLQMSLSFEEVKEMAGTGSIGRPHIAQLLMKKKYVNTVEEGFKQYLTRGKPLYVPRYKVTPIEAVKIIKAAKGVPVLAHPGLYPKKWLLIVRELITAGLKGIEVYYPNHSAVIIEQLLELCKQEQLVPTGGSDYHGEGIKINKLGSYTIAIETIKQMEENINGFSCRTH